jgi:hypothetical protein
MECENNLWRMTGTADYKGQSRLLVHGRHHVYCTDHEPKNLVTERALRIVVWHCRIWLRAWAPQPTRGVGHPFWTSKQGRADTGGSPQSVKRGRYSEHEG